MIYTIYRYKFVIKESFCSLLNNIKYKGGLEHESKI